MAYLEPSKSKRSRSNKSKRSRSNKSKRSLTLSVGTKMSNPLAPTPPSTPTTTSLLMPSKSDTLKNGRSFKAHSMSRSKSSRNANYAKHRKRAITPRHIKEDSDLVQTIRTLDV